MSARPTVQELRADLVLLGRAPSPAPRPTFVAALEERLTAIAMDNSDRLDVDVDVDVNIVPAARGRGPGLAVAVALAVVLSTAGLAVVSSGDGRDARTATVETASDITAGGSHVNTVDGGDAVTPPGSQPASGLGRGWPSNAAPGSSAPSTIPSAVVTAPLDFLAKPSAGATQPAQLSLRGSGTPAYSFLEWDHYGGDDFAAYLVLRAAAPDDPTWPDESGRTLMLMRIEDRDTTRYEAQGKVGTTPRFRIVAVDRAGGVIARSGVFQADVGAGLSAPRDLDPSNGVPPAP